MVSSEFFWRARWNKPAGWRQRLGQFLRRQIDRFDGRESVAFEIISIPPLAQRQKVEILLAGFREVERMVDEAVRAESAEAALRVGRPDLYADCSGAARGR